MHITTPTEICTKQRKNIQQTTTAIGGRSRQKYDLRYKIKIECRHIGKPGTPQWSYEWPEVYEDLIKVRKVTSDHVCIKVDMAEDGYPVARVSWWAFIA